MASYLKWSAILLCFGMRSLMEGSGLCSMWARTIPDKVAQLNNSPSYSIITPDPTCIPGLPLPGASRSDISVYSQRLSSSDSQKEGIVLCARFCQMANAYSSHTTWLACFLMRFRENLFPGFRKWEVSEWSTKIMDMKLCPWVCPKAGTVPDTWALQRENCSSFFLGACRTPPHYQLSSVP